jgi:tetratricopeptide (TPR) repeat protein
MNIDAPQASSSAGSVTWMTDAKRDLDDRFCLRLESELRQAFAITGNLQIVVKQRFRGFSDEPHQKLILAVEVQGSEGAHASVIKIGDSSHVGGDYTGWQACAGSRGIVSRMLIAPIMRNVGDHRVAIIYPDVYQYYFNNGRDDEPKELETIVEQSILRNSPTFTSVERVLTQVFTEAHRCFYRNAQEDPTSQHVLKGVAGSLELHKSPSVLERWQREEYLKLRRGAAWLTCGNRSPDSLTRPEYIDPIDYLQWLLPARIPTSVAHDSSNSNRHAVPETADIWQPEGSASTSPIGTRIPPMLIGPAHGDLHGRNVIVGVVRGEAEWPAVFDFDKMSNWNLVAWDFAKLELELKCRILPQLLESPADRQQLRQLLGLSELQPMASSVPLSPDDVRVQQRAERMRIMFAIEQRLHAWSTAISSRGMAVRPDVEFEPAVPSETALGRALRIIFRIRCEAAAALGYERQGREDRWRDEYYFALATYGVTTAKWHSASDHLAWCLLSAGVAAAALSQLPWPPDPNVTPRAVFQSDFSEIATYLQLLPCAHACWKSGRWDEPIPMLQAAIQRFPYAVALRQQLALSLAQSDSMADEEAARREIESLAGLACVFRDHETLCRLGRIYKDRADRLHDGQFSHAEMIEDKLPSWQHYLAALKHYHAAFEFSNDYYPAVNAATLALLVGDHVLQTELAARVLSLCSQFDLDRPDQVWILASEGEASLLLGNTEQAVKFYRGALDRILPREVGVVQSMYDQLCRLQWALGKPCVRPVIDMLEREGRLAGLTDGPFAIRRIE